MMAAVERRAVFEFFAVGKAGLADNHAETKIVLVAPFVRALGARLLPSLARATRVDAHLPK